MTKIEYNFKAGCKWFSKTDDSHNLSNLLACLNGDGGHYQAKHGTKKAIQHALERYYKDNMLSSEVRRSVNDIG